jgi:hypothetical protein
MPQQVSMKMGQQFMGLTVGRGRFVQLAVNHPDDGSRGSAVAHDISDSEQEAARSEFQMS